MSMDPASTALSQAAAWQTGTALVQAVCSVSLLGWYVLAAHLDRRRLRREKADDFDSLVRLCRDLGAEAQDKTAAHRRDAAAAPTGAVGVVEAQRRLALWRSDMQVIYVCLNEVPHYEVRNPAFSTALTRLWLAVDARSLQDIAEPQTLVGFLDAQFDRICREVDAMALLLEPSGAARAAGLRRTGGRRGNTYPPAA
jgi:hypothetical protein